jgi:hypothetical protein
MPASQAIATETEVSNKKGENKQTKKKGKQKQAPTETTKLFLEWLQGPGEVATYRW